MDRALEYEQDEIVIELLRLTKFWFGTEFASKTPAERYALLSSDDTEVENGGESGTGSFGSAYRWGKENWDEAIRAGIDYLFGVGPAVIRPNQGTYPSADQMAMRLKTTRDDFHKRIKEEMKRDFNRELKKIGNPRNFDIGVDRKGHIVLKNRVTNKEINTGVPLKTYSK